MQNTNVDQSIPLIGQRELIPFYQGEKWSSALCDCCSGENANCCVCCFACCSIGIGYSSLLEELGLVDSCAVSALLCLGMEALTGRLAVNWALFSLRRNLVRNLGRNEDICSSFCISCCCQPCAIAQMERDSKSRDYKFDRPKSYLKTFQRSVGYFDNEKPIAHYIGLEMMPLAPYTSNRMI